MMSRAPSIHRPLWSTAAALLALLGTARGAHAQTRWKVDAATSLAWWQMSPNMNHLWATTCPADPSWRPGEERSPGWHFDPNLKLPSTGYGNVDDTIHVPLFPRRRVVPVCVEAVRGEILVGDTAGWHGTHGSVFVEGDALITGEAMRDNMMHRALQTWQHPEIEFDLDSLVDVTQDHDTTFGTGVGILIIRGQADTTRADITMYPIEGGMRVLAKWRVSAAKLFSYIPSVKSFGLGLDVWLWHYFFMGADLVFHPDTAVVPAPPAVPTAPTAPTAPADSAHPK